MQDHIRYLVVEDRPDWSQALNREVTDYFAGMRGLSRQRIKANTAYDGDQANDQLRDGSFDLVTLDMNLGQSASGSKISGLDVLAQIARNNSAYFVLIITGAVNDPELEKNYGPEAAALMRYGALNEAVKRLPAERVRILNKPGDAKAANAIDKIRSQIHSALDQYCNVSRERNIFRPLPGNPDLWEVRYNGGERMNIPHAEPYQMIRSALAQPGRALPVIQLMQRIAQGSGQSATVVENEKERKPGTLRPSSIDYAGHQEDDVSGDDGLDWSEMEGFSVEDHAPVYFNDQQFHIEDLIGALLAAQRAGTLQESLPEIVNFCGEEVLLTIPAKAMEWAKRGDAADTVFRRDDASSSLAALAAQLRPLLRPIYLRLQAKKEAEAAGREKAPKTKKNIRVAQAVDTPEMKLARAHWKRFKEYIGRREMLGDFLEHVRLWIPRDPTTKGHLHYRPPTSSDLYPFWLTE